MDQVVLHASVPVAALAGTWVGGPVGGYLAAAGVMGIAGGYSRYQDGQGWYGAIQGGVSDGTGWTQLYGAWTNRDVITKTDLGWSEGERWLYGGLAALQIAGVYLPVILG